MNLRDSFFVKLLSACTPSEVLSYTKRLEEIVHNSPFDLQPGASWVEPDGDTLLLFLGDLLIAGLRVRRVTFLDPLVFEVPQSLCLDAGIGERTKATLLNDFRCRAEGFIQAHGAKEYFFLVPAGAADYLRILDRLGGMERVEERVLFHREL